MQQSYLTVKEIAETLRIPVPVVWRLIRDGEIPAHRIGKMYRIAQVDFDTYLKRTRTTGVDEEEEEFELAS